SDGRVDRVRIGHDDHDRCLLVVRRSRGAVVVRRAGDARQRAPGAAPRHQGFERHTHRRDAARRGHTRQHVRAIVSRRARALRRDGARRDAVRSACGSARPASIGRSRVPLGRRAEGGAAVTDVRWRPTRFEVKMGLASALLFALAFPPVPLVVPAFVCLVPVGIVVADAADRRSGWRVAMRAGTVFGFFGYGISLYWIAIALKIYTDLAFLAFAGALLGLGPIVGFTFAAVYAVRRLTKWPMAIVLPVVWAASEMFLLYLPQLGFPWLPLGLAVAKTTVLAQAADLSGVRGLSFWIAATNGLLVDAWLLRADRRRMLARVAAVVAFALGIVAYGVWRMKTIQLLAQGPVTIVQPNIPQDEKWQQQYQGKILGILTSLSRQALANQE